MGVLAAGAAGIGVFDGGTPPTQNQDEQDEQEQCRTDEQGNRSDIRRRRWGVAFHRIDATNGREGGREGRFSGGGRQCNGRRCAACVAGCLGDGFRRRLQQVFLDGGGAGNRIQLCLGGARHLRLLCGLHLGSARLLGLQSRLYDGGLAGAHFGGRCLGALAGLGSTGDATGKGGGNGIRLGGRRLVGDGRLRDAIFGGRRLVGATAGGNRCP